MKDPMELVLAAGSVASYWLFAQVSAPGTVVDYIQPVVTAGLAVWLVVYHTRVTIPGMQAAHKVERQEDRAAFQTQLGQMQADHKNQLAEERRDHVTEMERQRVQFAEMLGHSCKFSK